MTLFLFASGKSSSVNSLEEQKLYIISIQALNMKLQLYFSQNITYKKYLENNTLQNESRKIH